MVVVPLHFVVEQHQPLVQPAVVVSPIQRQDLKAPQTPVDGSPDHHSQRRVGPALLEADPNRFVGSLVPMCQEHVPVVVAAPA